ncbi:MAG: sigma-70 family RNA polymerase sigma factor [Aquiluna sp.]
MLEQYRANPTIELRNKIAVANDRLARKIASRQSATTDTPLEDLEQLARQGMLKAIERFDPTKGHAFSSFAVPYIRGEIQHYLRDRQLIKVPRAWRETRDKVARLSRRMTDAGRPTTMAQAAAALGISPAQWDRIEAATDCHLTVGMEADIYSQSFQDDAEDQEAQDQTRDVLCQAIAQLNPLQQQLITESYWGGLSIKALALRSGLSQAQAKVELAKALHIMRSFLCSN